MCRCATAYLTATVDSNPKKHCLPPHDIQSLTASSAPFMGQLFWSAASSGTPSVSTIPLQHSPFPLPSLDRLLRRRLVLPGQRKASVVLRRAIEFGRKRFRILRRECPVDCSLELLVLVHMHDVILLRGRAAILVDVLFALAALPVGIVLAGCLLAVFRILVGSLFFLF